MAETKLTLHKGHRQRMKREFLERGLVGLPDHKVLELLLYYAIPQRDVNGLAHQLVEHFGGLCGVLNAPYEQLRDFTGLGENSATLLKLVLAVGGRYIQGQSEVGRILTDTWQFKEVLAPYFFGARHELAYLVCMDGKQKFLACKKLSEGDNESTALTERALAEAVISTNACIVALAHNHVSGLALPSRADQLMTKKMYHFLKSINVELYDHFVFTDDEIISMRESGYFRAIDQR